MSRGGGGNDVHQTVERKYLSVFGKRMFNKTCYNDAHAL